MLRSSAGLEIEGLSAGIRFSPNATTFSPAHWSGGLRTNLQGNTPHFAQGVLDVASVWNAVSK